MNYGTCVKCKKMIGYHNIRMCESCKEEEFNKIKEYLDEHGITSISEICEKLGESKKLITNFILDGRLDAKYIPQSEIDELVDENRRSQLMNTLNALQENAKSIEEPKKIIISEETKGSKMRYLGRR